MVFNEHCCVNSELGDFYFLSFPPEHLLQMKIKDLRSTVRELVLRVKGRKKDDVDLPQVVFVFLSDESGKTSDEVARRRLVSPACIRI